MLRIKVPVGTVREREVERRCVQRGRVSASGLRRRESQRCRQEVKRRL